MDIATIPSQTLVDDVAKGVKIIGEIASVEEKVMPYAMMIGGLFPGVATVLGAIALAQPYIDKVAQYAPQVSDVIEQKGVPVVDAIRQVEPALMGHIKSAYSALAAADPTLSNLSAGEISDAVAGEFFKTMLAANYFTPQDPRFDRGNPSQF